MNPSELGQKSCPPARWARVLPKRVRLSSDPNPMKNDQYEAGPTGYALYWQLTKLGVMCDIISPSLIPKKPGEKAKTDRRDAEKLAKSYRAGDLTPVWVSDSAHEALRDLVLRPHKSGR